MAGPAQAALIPNGGFETGDFSFWSTDGNVFIDTTANTTNNVIAGNFSAALTNNPIAQPPTVGACSYLESDTIFPLFVPRSVNVTFKLRYKTDESIGGTPWDPAHAVVWTEGGAVNVFTINASGVTQGPGFSVTRLDTNVMLPPAPTIPPFGPGVFYENETPTLLVTGNIPVNTCDGVYIIFDVCQYLDLDTNSALWVDDVQVTFANASIANIQWWKTPPTTGVPCQAPEGGVSSVH